MSHRALQPGQLGALRLRNRFIKTATYEGMTPGGRITDQLIAHHAQLAQNQVALTTVAYAAVHADGRTFEDQLLLDEVNRPGLARLAAAVHAAGGGTWLAGMLSFASLAPERCLRLLSAAPSPSASPS